MSWTSSFAACGVNWTKKEFKRSFERYGAQGMSSKRSRKIYKTFRFRLTIAFSLAFIVLSLLLFTFAYFLLSSSLQANDRTAVTLKLKEYSDEYGNGSIHELERKIKI